MLIQRAPAVINYLLAHFIANSAGPCCHKLYICMHISFFFFTMFTTTCILDLNLIKITIYVHGIHSIFSVISTASAQIHAFLGFSFTGASKNIFLKSLASFRYNLSNTINGETGLYPVATTMDFE